MSLLGAIFDLDGLLVDSEPVQATAFNMVLEEYGINLGEDEFSELVGIETIENFRMLRRRYSLPETAERLLERKTVFYHELVRTQLAPMPGAVSLLSALHDEGLPLAVASSSPEADVTLCLAAVGIAHFFSHVVTADDVEQRKPAPDLYRLAARRLGLTPAYCVAFEDTGTGLQAAVGAGVPCIVVPNRYTLHHNFSAALAKLDSLSLLDPDKVHLLHSGAHGP